MLLLSCLPTLGLMLAAPCASWQPPSQTHRPDAEGYPCDSTRKLAIIQDGASFTIREPEPVEREDGPDPAKAVIKAVIAIGTALKIDRAILSAASGTGTEVPNAPRR